MAQFRHLTVKKSKVALRKFKAADTDQGTAHITDRQGDQHCPLGHPGQGEQPREAIGLFQRKSGVGCRRFPIGEKITAGFQPPLSVRHNSVSSADRGDSAIEHGIVAVALVAVYLQIYSAFRDFIRCGIYRSIKDYKRARAVCLKQVLPQRFKEQLLYFLECIAIAVKFGKCHFML